METSRKNSDRQNNAPFMLGTIEVNPETLELVSNGASTRLEPKIMDLLVFFSKRPGEVLSKHQILESVWGGTTVVDEALQRAISILRKALGDNKNNPRFIETISKKGYRLIPVPVPLKQNFPHLQKTKKERSNPSLLVILMVATFLALASYLVWTQIIAPEHYAPAVPVPDED